MKTLTVLLMLALTGCAGEVYVPSQPVTAPTTAQLSAALCPVGTNFTKVTGYMGSIACYCVSDTDPTQETVAAKCPW